MPALALLIGSLGACAGSGGGDAPVEFAAEDLRTGEAVDVTALRGSPVLLSSWATWCEPCKEEMPELQRLYEDRHTDGLEIVAVNVNASGPDERRIEPMADDWGLTMRLWRDADNDFTSQFDGIGVPMSVLLDADGRPVETWFGAIDTTDPDFTDAIDAVLADAAAT